MLRKLSASIALLTVILFSQSILAQGANPFIGTWDIDFSASGFGSAVPPANMSRTYVDHGDDSYTYIVIRTNPDSSLSASTSHYSYNGEQTPIASFNQDQQATISYRKINNTTVEYTVYVDGEVQQIGAKFVSPNYQQLTISIQYPNSDQENQVLIFNKRR